MTKKSDAGKEPETSFSLIKVNVNLECASKAVIELIDAVRNGLGLIYVPTHLRMMTAACLDVSSRFAETDPEARQLFERSMGRYLSQEVRRQKNIEAIANGAIASLPEHANDKPVDTDWIAYFLDQCKEVGDEEMQSIWSRILAGEVSQPGTYSLRTLNFVRTLCKEEAQLFTAYCAYCFPDLPAGAPYRFTVAKADDYLDKHGMEAFKIRHLVDIGLVRDGMHTLSAEETVFTFPSYYFGKQYVVTKEDKGIPHYVYDVQNLTALGCEIYPIAGAKPDFEYLRNLLDCCKAEGFEVAVKC